MAKTVGSRLRGIHSNDLDLLEALHNYSGYMVARGYEEVSVKYHLAIHGKHVKALGFERRL